jgi:uridine kinase
MTRRAIIDKLAEMINAVSVTHPLRVAVDGVDGAGKTMLGDELVASLFVKGRPVIRASVDGFHNPLDLRYKRGPDSPDGYYMDSFQYNAIRNELLIPLGPGGSRIYRSGVYSCVSETPVLVKLQEAPRNAILLFDGVFLLRPELIDCWDYKIFVDVGFDLSVERAVARDSSSSKRGFDANSLRMRYVQRYVPGQYIYLQSVGPKKKADVIFDNTRLDFPKLIEP